MQKPKQIDFFYLICTFKEYKQKHRILILWKVIDIIQSYIRCTSQILQMTNANRCLGEALMQ